MSAFTPHLNLELPGGGSLGIGGEDETADIDDLNQNFQKLDTWADGVDDKLDEAEEQAFFIGTEAERIAMVPPKLRDGVRFKVTDTGVEWDRAAGAWRKLHGRATLASAAWQTTATSGAVIFAGRTATFTIPYILAAGESVIVTQETGGSGFSQVSMSAITRNPTNTTVTVRLTQFQSTSTQAFTVLWRIVPTG